MCTIQITSNLLPNWTSSNSLERPLLEYWRRSFHCLRAPHRPNPKLGTRWLVTFRGYLWTLLWTFPLILPWRVCLEWTRGGRRTAGLRRKGRMSCWKTRGRLPCGEQSESRKGVALGLLITYVVRWISFPFLSWAHEVAFDVLTWRES